MNAVLTPVHGLRKLSAAPVWIAAVASLLVVSALFVGGQGTLLRMAIPAGATLVGTAIYFCRPIGYIHFTLWTWFLTPFIRRLVDWRVGFEDHNLVLAAPLLVSAIAAITLLRERRFAKAAELAPFYLCIAGVFYGFAVGMIRWRLHTSDGASPGEVAYGLFDWLAPLLFGLHLSLRWRMYEDHKKALQKSFLWGVFLLGAYGIYQFVAPPVWDTLWLEHMLSEVGAESFGRPEAFQVRVWSTLNSPGVFANFLLAGLLLLFSSKSRIKALVAGVGYSSFILTLVRTSWLGWIVGLVVLARGSKGGQIPRLLFSLLLLPVLVAPLMLNARIAELVTERFLSLQSTKQDESMQDRTTEYRALFLDFAEDPFGEGLSNAATFHGYIMDSGILRLLYSCGWIGASFFVAGVMLCARRMAPGRNNYDPFAAPLQAIFIALIFEQLSGNTFVGPTGLILWTSVGLSTSLHHFGQRQSSVATEGLVHSPNNRTSLVA